MLFCILVGLQPLTAALPSTSALGDTIHAAACCLPVLIREHTHTHTHNPCRLTCLQPPQALKGHLLTRRHSHITTAKEYTSALLL